MHHFCNLDVSQPSSRTDVAGSIPNMQEECLLNLPRPVVLPLILRFSLVWRTQEKANTESARLMPENTATDSSVLRNPSPFFSFPCLCFRGARLSLLPMRPTAGKPIWSPGHWVHLLLCLRHHGSRTTGPAFQNTALFMTSQRPRHTQVTWANQVPAGKHTPLSASFDSTHYYLDRE